jgi:hypothetical protein
MPEMSTDERVLCDIQGRLFENSLTAGYDSPSFIAAFMNSEIAEYMDKPYDRYQWAGEEYLMEALLDETNGLPEAGILYDKEVMYWCGYIYRYWHYYTGESSRQIYAVADAEKMNRCWLAFHTLDVEMAIDDLKANRAV